MVAILAGRLLEIGHIDFQDGTAYRAIPAGPVGDEVSQQSRFKIGFQVHVGCVPRPASQCKQRAASPKNHIVGDMVV